VAVLGGVYPFLAAALGAIGCFMTGSTTSSNALFSSLQAETATLLGLPRPALLATQTAGANVGNALAPVVVTIGATAVDAGDHEPAILRRTALPAVALLGLVRC
jgi:lactate permease